jgi:hypothetical protein
MDAQLATLSEIFTNSTLPPERLQGPFGVCYVAFAGTHLQRYRGERLLEASAKQLSAAAEARGTSIPQCVFTDQPERSRPYVQLSLPLRTSLDAAPYVAKCEEYTRLFNRPCKLLFGYMAKAIAAARAPYSTTIFVDTDTFVCDAAPLIALGTRLMASWDLLLLVPRSTQGWVNSGVLAVHRESARGWAMAWQREFLSLDDFGDQLHLLKVLPQRTDDAIDAPNSPVEPPRPGGRRAGGKGGGSWRGGGGGSGSRRTRGALVIGEMPAELHLRVGFANTEAATRLPALRGPVMLLHSKSLAALSSYGPFLAQRFASGAGATTSAQRQVISFLGDGNIEAKRKGEHALYSPRVLAGFCAMLNEGWIEEPIHGRATRQLILNSEGNCSSCSTLTPSPGSIGVISGNNPMADEYECSINGGDCGIRSVSWPSGSERGLPSWYLQWLKSRSATV